MLEDSIPGVITSLLAWSANYSGSLHVITQYKIHNRQYMLHNTDYTIHNTQYIVQASISPGLTSDEYSGSPPHCQASMVVIILLLIVIIIVMDVIINMVYHDHHNHHTPSVLDICALICSHSMASPLQIG